MTEVQRSSDGNHSPKKARAEDVALAVMGGGVLADETIAEAARRDFAGGAVAGRDAIQAREIAQLVSFEYPGGA